MWIKLSQVTETQSGGGYDDLEQPVPVTTVVTTTPISINTDQVREFYPRRLDRNTGTKREGTRVVFANGAAQIVSESHDEVARMISSRSSSRSRPAPTTIQEEAEARMEGVDHPHATAR